MIKQTLYLLAFSILALPAFGASYDLHRFVKFANRSTNELVLDKEFKEIARNFFGKEKDHYLSAKSSLTSDTVIEVLHGRPQKVTLKDNHYLIASACRAHSCREKGIAIMDIDSGQIGYGIVHYSLDWSDKSRKSHNKEGYLTVFTKKSATSEFKERFMDIVHSWQLSFEEKEYKHIVSLIPRTQYLE